MNGVTMSGNQSTDALLPLVNFKLKFSQSIHDSQTGLKVNFQHQVTGFKTWETKKSNQLTAAQMYKH